MKEERRSERWLAFEPLHVRADHGRLERAIIAIEVDAVLVFARVAQRPGGVQARNQPETDVVRPMFLVEKPEHGEWTSRFIAVNASGDINPFARVGNDTAKRGQ